MKQATTPEGLKRWFVFTRTGRKITWAKSADEARIKCEANGFVVDRVATAPSLLATQRK